MNKQTKRANFMAALRRNCTPAGEIEHAIRGKVSVTTDGKSFYKLPAAIGVEVAYSSEDGCAYFGLCFHR